MHITCSSNQQTYPISNQRCRWQQPEMEWGIVPVRSICHFITLIMWFDTMLRQKDQGLTTTSPSTTRSGLSNILPQLLWVYILLVHNEK